MKKNILSFFPAILPGVLLITGCIGQVQPAITTTAAFRPADTSVPEVTSTSLPSPTPLPTMSLHSFPPLPPLPKGIFDPFRESIYDPTDFANAIEKLNDIVKTTYGVISSGDTIEEKVALDSSQGHVVVSLFWEAGSLDLTLIQPDGTVITPSMAVPVQYFELLTDDLISIKSDSVREKYYLYAPWSGIWTIRIVGKSTPATGSNYMIQVTSIDAMSFSGHFDKNEYGSGDVIRFSASMEDGVIELENIRDISIQAIVEDPAKKQYSFKLYDDGLHKDGKADDGVYAGTFSNTSLAGKYNFYLQISGKNNRAKEPFTREYYLSTIVR